MPATASPVPNALGWLENLYELCSGWLTLFSVDRTNGAQRTDWSPVAGLPDLAVVAEERAKRSCVWFGVATRRERLTGGRRGGASDCLEIPALWADLDVTGPNHRGAHQLPPTIEAALELLTAFPLVPTAVTRSGGGLQGWWMFAEPLPVDKVAEELLVAWGATWVELGRRKGWHVDNVFDVARIMRLPGTWNRKNEPVLVTAKAYWDLRYNPSDFEPHLLEAPKAPERGRIPYIGPERPGDAFNAVRRGGDVLHQAGFTLARVDRSNGEEHWTRPGKATKDGASATVYADGHTTLWSDTIQQHWPEAELRRPYDPFGLFAIFFSEGDFTVASETLALQGYGVSARAQDDLSWISGASTPREGAPAPEATTFTDAQPDLNAPTTDTDPRLERAILNERLRRQARRAVDTEEQGIEHDLTGDTTGIQPVAWADFWLRERPDEDWLIEPVVPRGRHVAVWAVHKTGKSLITLEMAAASATGRSCLGLPAKPPIDVIYLDMEMTEDDLYERLSDMGYDEGADLSRLHYYLLPALPPLDHPEGGAAVVQLVGRHQAELVVVDTMSRAVVGDENLADTYRAFHRHTGRELKATNTSLVRIDHGGKNPELGQRGSSAKGDDVDLVWQLDSIDSGLVLMRTASRVGWAPERVPLHRSEDPFLTHRVSVETDWPAGTKGLADRLDELGVPLDASRREAGRLLREADGKGPNNALLGKAIKFRRQRGWKEGAWWSTSTSPERSQGGPG